MENYKERKQTKKSEESSEMDIYAPIVQKIEYWRDYTGTGDAYRKEHDWDCILTGGNLLADAIFSLWLPLRYSLNHYDCNAWKKWKEYEHKELRPKKLCLKDCTPFLNELCAKIENYLPRKDLTLLLAELFQFGQMRCNVMILPYRSWNKRRGDLPYYDFLPHFLYDLLSTDSPLFLHAIREWVRQESLQMFFIDEIIDKDHIKDLAGTGAPYRHSPNKIDLYKLISNYITILEEREHLISDVV